MKVSGVYLIFNRNSKKIYIGSSCDIETRCRKHKSLLRNQKHDNVHLQRSFNKHGEAAFKFSIIEKVNDVSQLLNREQYWLDKIKQKFNILKKAGNTLGYKPSIETRRKISLANSKRTGSKNYWFGKRLHPNTLNAAATVCSKQFIKEGNPFWGKTHSIKTRKNLSEKLTGRKMPNSFIEKQRGNARGSKTYRVTSPDGKLEVVHNLKKYCETLGLKTQNVRSAMFYQRKYQGHLFELIQPLS